MYSFLRSLSLSLIGDSLSLFCSALEVVAQPWILALGEVDPALLARALGVKVPHRRQSQRLQNRSAHERAKSRRARMSLEKYFLEVIEAAAEMGKQGGDGGGGDGGDGSGDDGGDGSGDDGGDGGGDDGVLG
ncbi:single-stranded DNA-binding protein 2-like [Brassica napus]|uniref:single-stranded DNA-binding protein 2-like n=1 Tax=Brassica napus TaxID=3708 RepID=UPI0020787194|nr:single-stranded DNA-binding protein 2-like [Brassica napus]XP_048629062.1 single-stranded DNA-binding protein 2-like [Brassica napus]